MREFVIRFVLIENRGQTKLNIFLQNVWLEHGSVSKLVQMFYSDESYVFCDPPELIDNQECRDLMRRKLMKGVFHDRW